MSKKEDLPLAASTIADGALAEIEHLRRVVEGLSPNDWPRRSAVAGWTVGDVVAHLNLFIGLYGRLLGSILVGGASSHIARLIGWSTDSILPRSAPIFDVLNAALPKVVGRLSAPDVVKGQFVAGAHMARERLLQAGRDHHSDAVSSTGGPDPRSFYLAILINELAIHGWDIESTIGEGADLSDAARGILPWFYWSSTRLMFRPPGGTRGTVQVLLSEPGAAMWWSLAERAVGLGRGAGPHPSAEIRGPSGAYVLAVAGRVSPAEAMRSGLTVDGDRGLAESFLGGWHLI